MYPGFMLSGVHASACTLAHHLPLQLYHPSPATELHAVALQKRERARSWPCWFAGFADLAGLYVELPAVLSHVRSSKEPAL